MVVVMEELRRKIYDAFKQMSNEKVIDKEVMYACLAKIFQAIYMSDIKYEVVLDLQTNVMKTLNLDEFAKASHHEKIEIVRKALVNELCKLLDPGEPSFTPKKGETSVVMFVGLQGSGKTTTCIKYAYYHLMKGWKPALVGADIFTTGAFDQWKNNATNAKIPFHGSYLESDPVKIATEGVERFKKENCDLIIVDTSGRHKLEADLLEEICKIYKETKPDLVIFSVDSSFGKAAFDQTQAFMRSVAVGAVIFTKMDGHAKGGGALSVAAATKCPVTFIGTGKRMDEFEVFDVKLFVSRLIGLGDSLSGSMDKINEIGTGSQQSELLQKLSKGQFTLRIMYEICQKLLNWSKYQQVLELLPGFCQELMPNDSEIESMAKIKCFMTMMDLLTNQELDSPKPKLVKNSRINQIATGCGCEVREVMELLEVFNRLAKIWSNMKWLRFPGRPKTSLGGKSGVRNIEKTKSRSYRNATLHIRI